jgi:hypothetical protein
MSHGPLSQLWANTPAVRSGKSYRLPGAARRAGAGFGGKQKLGRIPGGARCRWQLIFCGTKGFQIKQLIGLPSLAGEPGFEPRQTESESVVLPLHHSPPKWLILQHFFREFSKIAREFSKSGVSQR